jgi:hypothetical protein
MRQHGHPGRRLQRRYRPKWAKRQSRGETINRGGYLFRLGCLRLPDN